MSHRTPSKLLLAGLALVLAAVPVSGQEKLAEGTWTGSVYPPGEDIVYVEYVVTYSDEKLEIALVPPPELGMGEVPAYEVMHETDILTFNLEVGASVNCALYLEDDGTFEGECVDSSGEGALMTMIPPDPS